MQRIHETNNNRSDKHRKDISWEKCTKTITGENRMKYKPIICYHCKYCFRDDWYGVCCQNKKSEHYTRNWDLPIDTIEDCEYFEEEI